MGKGLFVEFQTSPLALRTGIPFMAPVEHCKSITMIPIVVRPSMGGSRPLDPGSNPGRSTISYSQPIRYFRRMIGTVVIPTEAMRAIARPAMPTPSSDITSDVVISIKKEPLVEMTEFEVCDS